MRRIKNALAPYYSRIYYSDKSKWDKFVLKYMNGCSKILDVGCGYGRFIENDPKRIWGIDGNEHSVKECKKRIACCERECYKIAI